MSDETSPTPEDASPHDMERRALETIVCQAMGFASVCWDNMEGTGTFHSEEALAVAKGAVNEIMRIYDNLIESAWGIIANVGHKQGNWEAQDPEWVQWAEAWRERYHTHLEQLRLAPHVIYNFEELA